MGYNILMASICYLGGSQKMYDGLLGMVALRDAIDHHNFLYIDTSKVEISSYIIDHINQFADLIIVGRTGLYRDVGLDRYYSINAKNINIIKKPIVFSSIGDHIHPYDKKNLDLSIYDVLVSGSELFSVGSDSMSEKLIKAGILEDNICTVPDTSMFVRSTRTDHPIFNTDKIKIGVEIATDFADLRYKDERQAISNILSFVEQIKAGAEVYLFSKLESPYINIFDCFQNELLEPSEYGARLLNSLYHEMDIIIGSSAQPALIAIGAAIPFMGIGRDPWLRAVMSDLSVKWSERSLQVEALVGKFNEMMENIVEYKQSLEMRREQCKFIKTWFAAEIDKIIKGDK